VLVSLLSYLDMKTSAYRLDRLSPQFFAGLNEKIAATRLSGGDIIRLDIGSPDMPPAAHIIEALNQASQKNDLHGYQPHNATRALRQAWAEMYWRTYGVSLDPDQEIIPLLGSKEGIFHLTMALIDPGDIVLIPDPGYLTYTQGTLLAGGEPYYLPLLAENQYLPRLESIPELVAQRASLLWLNYPNNPTAATATEEFFAAAVRFARQYDILICHDAAYNQVTFDAYRAPSLLQVPGAKEVAIEFNTLSKSHNMAGWRVGSALGQADALHSLYVLKTNADSGHFLPVLEAATVALTGDQDWLVERNDIYRRRRDLAVTSLHDMGAVVKSPQASLYVWASVPTGWSSLEFTTTLLERANVSLTPGPVFGRHGEGYVRIALTETEDRIGEAMQRIAALEIWGNTR
jgi:LL-diaminopimelate aminotransferase